MSTLKSLSMLYREPSKITSSCEVQGNTHGVSSVHTSPAPNATALSQLNQNFLQLR